MTCRRRTCAKLLINADVCRMPRRSGRGGRRFKSCHSDQDLAYLDKAIPTVSPTDWNGIRAVPPTLSAGGGSNKIADNPMDQDVETRLGNLRRAPRCGAMTRAGTPCQRPAIRGRRRCRLHGGASTGAPRGHKNGNFRNGNWTADAIEERRWLRSLVQSFANNGTTE